MNPNLRTPHQSTTFFLLLKLTTLTLLQLSNFCFPPICCHSIAKSGARAIFAPWHSTDRYLGVSFSNFAQYCIAYPKGSVLTWTIRTVPTVPKTSRQSVRLSQKGHKMTSPDEGTQAEATIGDELLRRSLSNSRERKRTRRFSSIRSSHCLVLSSRYIPFIYKHSPSDTGN